MAPRKVVLLAGWVASFILCAPVQAGDRSDSKVKVSVKASAPDASGKQKVLVTIQIQEGWHIHANPVKSEGLEANATIITVRNGKDKLKTVVAYPVGTQDEIAGSKFMAYAGTVTIPVEFTRPASAAELRIDVRVSACSRTTCLLPGTASVMLP